MRIPNGCGQTQKNVCSFLFYSLAPYCVYFYTVQAAAHENSLGMFDIVTTMPSRSVVVPSTGSAPRGRNLLMLNQTSPGGVRNHSLDNSAAIRNQSLDNSGMKRPSIENSAPGLGQYMAGMPVRAQSPNRIASAIRRMSPGPPGAPTQMKTEVAQGNEVPNYENIFREIISNLMPIGNSQ